RLKHAELADISNLDARNQLRARDDHRRVEAVGNHRGHAVPAFLRESGARSMPFLHVVPPLARATELAHLHAAYDLCLPALQTKIDDLVCEHSIFHSRGQLGHTDYTAQERAALPPAHHRLVRLHPGSKRKTLYMGAHASHIVGWPVPDGRLLLRDLMEHATQ